MQLSKLEEDILGDLAQDSHEVWEIYAFIRSHHPTLQEDEVTRRGRKLIATWIDRGWLRASRSRTNTDILSSTELLSAIDEFGRQVSDPQRGVILLKLTDKAFNDVSWLPRPAKQKQS